jgi:putative sigma-54 modulation protein
MQLDLTGRHFDITPVLRRLVTTKISKLERVLNDSAVSAHVVLARERHRHLTEINLHARGEKLLHALADAATWEASLSEAFEKLAQQAVKIKGRRQSWKGRRAAAAARGASGRMFERREAAEVPAASRSARVKPRMPRTLRPSRQALKTMSVADAVRTIDGDQDGLVAFLDAETAAVCVLYRRHDGELSLVEIEL